MVRTDVQLLFATRMLRLFAYGSTSVILVLYIKAVGLSRQEIGLLVSMTMLGDLFLSLWLTTIADRVGRKRMLAAGAVLMMLGGIVFGLTGSFLPLLFAATIGVISPTGNEIGPFLPIEQAALTQSVDDQGRTRLFAWYHLAGALATALGSLAGGVLVDVLVERGFEKTSAYRIVFFGYFLIGVLQAGLFLLLSPAAEVTARPTTDTARPRLFLGLHRGRKVVLKLSALFALDAFAGAFVVQSYVSDWFNMRFGADTATLGAIFFGTNILAGFSALAAASLARRIGLIRTMVFTHVPSNILLILVPLMPNLPLAMTLLFLRFSISQMDVPARQSYTVAVVDPDERSAASGVTNVVRSTGASVAPVIAGPLLDPTLGSILFFTAGGLKLLYDGLLYRMFSKVRAPEESTQRGPRVS
jgi:MFS family permease